MVCHPLPLDRNMVFEIAHCPSTDWELGGVLPPACGWKPLTLCKAGDVVLTNNMNPVGVAFFNFGTGKPMAARKYVHIGERDGIYHFTARNKRNKDIIVRQAGIVAVTIVVKGRKLQAMSMSGNIVFEYEASLEESVRLYDFRQKCISPSSRRTRRH